MSSNKWQEIKIFPRGIIYLIFVVIFELLNISILNVKITKVVLFVFADLKAYILIVRIVN
jgi:hypothetical protein